MHGCSTSYAFCTAFIGGYGRGSLLRVDTFLWLLLMGHDGHELMLWLHLHHILSPGVAPRHIAVPVGND